MLLLLACLENVHLDPILFIVNTGGNNQHALVGCWKVKNRPGAAVIRKHSQIARYLPQPHGSGDLLLFDPNGFSVEFGWHFSKACSEGLDCFVNAGATGFVCGVDIAHTRTNSGKRKAISPMPFGEGPQLSGEGWAVVRRAEECAKTFRYDIVERAHLFLALLESATKLSQDLFGHHLPNLKTKIEERLHRKSPKKDVPIVQWTRSGQERLKRAGALSEEHGAGLIGSVQLFHALLEDPGDTTRRVLSESRIDVPALTQKLTDLATQDPQRDSYLESKSSHDGKED